MPIAWHAPYELLRPETRDMARAIHSLMEELEAMDWYSQRIDVSDDEQLRRILAHHAEEEKEHAVMLLEWIRRHDPQWDKHLRTYLFSSADLLEVEEREEPVTLAAEGLQVAPEPTSTAEQEMPSSFTVGSLRPRK